MTIDVTEVLSRDLNDMFLLLSVYLSLPGDEVELARSTLRIMPIIPP